MSASEREVRRGTRTSMGGAGEEELGGGGSSACIRWLYIESSIVGKTGGP